MNVLFRKEPLILFISAPPSPVDVKLLGWGGGVGGSWPLQDGESQYATFLRAHPAILFQCVSAEPGSHFGETLDFFFGILLELKLSVHG